MAPILDRDVPVDASIELVPQRCARRDAACHRAFLHPFDPRLSGQWPSLYLLISESGAAVLGWELLVPTSSVYLG